MSFTSDPVPAYGQLWHGALRRYFVVIAVGNLLWEFLHMPLYTIWWEETSARIVFAAVHCTGGDLLISLTALSAALLLAGDATWPSGRFGPVASLTIALGVSYAAFSEWLNIVERAAWQYSDWMPVIPVLGFEVGLSPLLQWIVVPAAAFWWAGRVRTRTDPARS